MLRSLTTAAAAALLVAATAQAADRAPVDAGLEARLGSAYAGSWLDGTAKHVALTDERRAAEVRAAGAEPVVVAHTLGKLDAIVDEMNAVEATAPPGVAGWGVDVRRNAVVVEVVGQDAAGTAWALAWRTRHDAVRIDTGAQAPRTFWNIIGGQAIYGGGSRCSAGFNARSGSTRYVLTAGHCTNLASSWTGVGGTLGTRAGTSFPGDDYGIIRVTSSSAASTALVDRYSAGSDVTVGGSAVTPIGGGVCRSGSTTGWRCGVVQAFNQTVRYPQGTVYGLTRTNVCAEGGDSGGSFVSNAVPRVQAQGLTSGGSGNCTYGGTTYFQPVGEVLSRYGVTLYTG